MNRGCFNLDRITTRSGNAKRPRTSLPTPDAVTRGPGPEGLRLPRRLETDPRAVGLQDALAARAVALWPQGTIQVAAASIEPALEAALKSAFSAGQIVRGLDAAERVLAAEARGLERVDRQSGVERGGRVSRLLLLADDGSERFYRNAEALLRRHHPRVLALRLDVDEGRLGGLLFGPGQVARLLLVERKEAVAEILLTLALQWGSDRAGA